jgi:hypothetical protein
MVDGTEPKWELYYWNNRKEDGKNHMIGRGEFVRLMFELAEVPFTEIGAQEGGPAKVFQMLDRAGKWEGFPLFAPPIIRKGDFVLY